MTDKKATLSRPRDESLEAFKAWMTEFIDHVRGEGAAEMPEERWIYHWKEFYRDKETKS